MNKLERVIYDLLKNNLLIKRSVKYLYQAIFIILPPKKVKCNYPINLAENYFFGFHDKIPWNYNNSYLLSHKITKSFNKVPKKKDEVEVGYFKDANLKEFKVVGKTKAWNWQQGAMLQWQGLKNNIVYNYWNGKKTITKIVDLDGKIIQELHFATGAVSNDGNLFVSYSFERLNRGMYGYGYANEGKFNDFDNDLTKSDGFSIYNFNGEKVIFKTINEINEKLAKRKFTYGYLFVTHFIFSPNNQSILFLLRSFKKNSRLASRLIVYSLVDNTFNVINTGNMVSHLSWVGNSKILAYCTNSDEKEGYYLFDIYNHEIVNVGSDTFTSDGHPSYYEKLNSFVTDTYPNRRRIQELSLYSFDKKLKREIGFFYTPLKYSDEFRCDLHPRWDRTGEKLCIDTTYSGKRSVCTISLNE